MSRLNPTRSRIEGSLRRIQIVRIIRKGPYSVSSEKVFILQFQNLSSRSVHHVIINYHKRKDDDRRMKSVISTKVVYFDRTFFTWIQTLVSRPSVIVVFFFSCMRFSFTRTKLIKLTLYNRILTITVYGK